MAAATAYDGTHQIELESGQKLLILGAGGGVGLMAAQIGRVHEFEVIGVARDPKRELVESTGATFVASGRGMTDQIRAIAPTGVDLVLDLVGGETLRAAASLVNDPGRMPFAGRSRQATPQAAYRDCACSIEIARNRARHCCSTSLTAATARRWVERC